MLCNRSEEDQRCNQLFKKCKKENFSGTAWLGKHFWLYALYKQNIQRKRELMYFLMVTGTWTLRAAESPKYTRSLHVSCSHIFPIWSINCLIWKFDLTCCSIEMNSDMHMSIKCLEEIIQIFLLLSHFFRLLFNHWQKTHESPAPFKSLYCLCHYPNIVTTLVALLV